MATLRVFVCFAAFVALAAAQTAAPTVRECIYSQGQSIAAGYSAIYAFGPYLYSNFTGFSTVASFKSNKLGNDKYTISVGDNVEFTDIREYTGSSEYSLTWTYTHDPETDGAQFYSILRVDCRNTNIACSFLLLQSCIFLNVNTASPPGYYDHTGLVWWIWLVIGICAFFLVGAAVGLVIFLTKRAKTRSSKVGLAEPLLSSQEHV